MRGKLRILRDCRQASEKDKEYETRTMDHLEQRRRRNRRQAQQD